MGSSFLPAREKTAVALCCHESVGWGMAEKTRRNGRRMKKTEENEAGVVGERRGKGSKGGWRTRRGSRKRLGRGDASLCFHVPLFQSLLHILGMLWRGAVTDSACAGLLQPRDGCAWDYSKRRAGSTWGNVGKWRQGSTEKGKAGICAP